jgi:hypothetical protein
MATQTKKPAAKKRPRGRPADPLLPAIQKSLGVKARQAKALKKKGVTAENLKDIESARLAKLVKEVEVLTEKLAILKREHIPSAKVREDSIAAFSVLKSSIVSQEVQLPPLLEGLTAKEMRTVIAGHNERMLKDLCERLESIT